MSNLENKIALITGASRGIGRACALELAHLGAKVAVNFLHSQEQAESVVSEIKKLGGEAVAIQADVSKKTDCEELIKQTLRNFGKIDILINNAGIMETPDALEIDEAAWELMMNINAKSVYLLSILAGNVMKKQGQGVIVNISSIAGEYPKSNCVYAATKGAVSTLTRGLAIDLAPEVRVNAVAPGRIETELVTPVDNDEDNQKIISCCLRQRLGQPEDIARIVVFLASPESDWINGEIIRADGGGIVKMAAKRNVVNVDELQ